VIFETQSQVFVFNVSQAGSQDILHGAGAKFSSVPHNLPLFIAARPIITTNTNSIHTFHFSIFLLNEIEKKINN
jgi:hypothetical protein